MDTLEANIDGLVGPTHNYAGLSFGNIASEKYALSASNPRAAALQGLAKMKFLHDLGIPQLVMPPHPRPAVKTMRELGFKNVEDLPDTLLHNLYSASAMWTANAATISPAADTQGGKTHITPANLTSKFHRSLEPSVTAHYLKQIFPEPHFIHHAPLPAHPLFSDEGAANHMRLCKSHKEKGIEIFVYGGTTQKFPARQSLDAAQSIIRLHGLEAKRTLFLKQSAAAIDAGVFHNDVIAMSNEDLFIYHENAYDDFDPACLNDFRLITISEKELPLQDAVSTYFFNSQLITLPNGTMAVIAPSECEEHHSSKACFDRLLAENHLSAVYYINLRESMKNGGGPACLRLRIPLTPYELSRVHSKAILNENLFNALCQWIEKHYRDRITSSDLRDPLLARESHTALSELYTIMEIA